MVAVLKKKKTKTQKKNRIHKKTFKYYKKSMEICNPTTPSQRHVIRINTRNLAKKPILKSKLIGFKHSSGRNNSGKITSYRKGGGHKKKYRKLDFYRIKNSSGIVTSIEYDPNRNANIASVYEFEKKKIFLYSRSYRSCSWGHREKW